MKTRSLRLINTVTMKLVVAVTILSTIHYTYSQELLCDDKSFRRRIGECYMDNDMGTLLAGFGMLEMRHICTYGQLPVFSVCMANVTKSCAPDWFDWERMADAGNRICGSQAFCPSIEGLDSNCDQKCNMKSDCGKEKICCFNGCGYDCMEPQYASDNCDLKDPGLSMCVTSMKKSWDENKMKSGVDEGKIWCSLNGGIKNCFSKYMNESCKSKWKYTDLVDTFGAKMCLEYNKCDICSPTVSSADAVSSSVTTLSSIAATAFLLRRL